MQNVIHSKWLMSSLGQNYKIGPLYCLENSNDLTHPNPGLITNLMNCHECTRNKHFVENLINLGAVFSVLYSSANNPPQGLEGETQGRSLVSMPCKPWKPVWCPHCPRYSPPGCSGHSGWLRPPPLWSHCTGLKENYNWFCKLQSSVLSIVRINDVES